MATRIAHIGIEAERTGQAPGQSEDQLRLVIETIPAMVWTALPDGSVDFVNGRWLQYVGLSWEDFSAGGWGPLVHPADLDRSEDYWRATLRSGKAAQIEHRIRRADGQYRWVLASGVPLRDGSGNIVKWYGTAIDIDDWKPFVASPLTELSAREIQVLKLVVEGRTSKAIAMRLGVRPATIDNYRSRIMAKLDVEDVPALVRLAIRCRLTTV